jgi:hypothetical protein
MTEFAGGEANDTRARAVIQPKSVAQSTSLPETRFILLDLEVISNERDLARWPRIDQSGEAVATDETKRHEPGGSAYITEALHSQTEKFLLSIGLKESRESLAIFPEIRNECVRLGRCTPCKAEQCFALRCLFSVMQPSHKRIRAIRQFADVLSYGSAKTTLDVPLMVLKDGNIFVETQEVVSMRGLKQGCYQKEKV